jgi:hypothetical protein
VKLAQKRFPPTSRPLPTRTFASKPSSAAPLFSYPYKLLFPQLLSFENDPSCPLVWRARSPFLPTSHGSRVTTHAFSRVSNKSFIYRFYADFPANSFIYRFYAFRPGCGGPNDASCSAERSLRSSAVFLSVDLSILARQSAKVLTLNPQGYADSALRYTIVTNGCR